jgi:small subunit ribosomal protein S2
MFPYIYTEQNGIHVIDLVQTARLLSHAYNYVQKAAKEGKTFLFIGTKRQAKNIIAEEATKCGSFFVDNRWLGGTLTNWSTVQGRVDYLKDLNQREASGELDRLPKKEAALLRREHDKLKNNLGGLTEMVQVPDIAIVVDPKRESTAIAECRKLGITVIAILDTICDPGMVDIPIPANDDAVRSIKLIISTLSDAIITGKQTSV